MLRGLQRLATLAYRPLAKEGAPNGNRLCIPNLC